MCLGHCARLEMNVTSSGNLPSLGRLKKTVSKMQISDYVIFLNNMFLTKTNGECGALEWI